MLNRPALWFPSGRSRRRSSLYDKLSIADFKAVPYFWAAICCEPKLDGFKVPAQIKEYVDAFFGAGDAAKILKEYGGYSIAEYTASRDKLE